MELKSSSPKSGGLSPPDCLSDPDEKEISDDDDDDRNHKHRRRDTMSQSLERDPLEQSLAQPYRKRNRPFENGQTDQSLYNSNRGFSKFEKRRPTGVNFSRFPGEHGSGRGRGRDFQRDSRFGSVDVASQMVHPGSIPSTMFTGRGLPNVSNAQSNSWNGFGLIPAIPNGGIDPINPLGLPGIIGPQLNQSLNMGMQRQRCRDFEERGFCLRGDMCPMEHGVNRIVVEDVQSLSQFNLPVSIPSAHMRGASAGSGFAPSVSVSSSTLMNNRGPHSRTNKSTVDDEALPGAVSASGADVYDPDQPLWNNDGHETSSPLLGLQPSSFQESDSFMDADFSDRLVRSSGAAVGSQSTSSSVWGRLNAKNKLELKEKGFPESRPEEICQPSTGTQGTPHLGKQNNGATFAPRAAGLTSKLHNDVGNNVRKPSQKAQRTLFVNCIPAKDNKKENLISHFRKFGEILDIYIPANSERAFVQFSKREDAERALKAPDAVMGSRFIKLWWANRDSIADDNLSNANSVSVTPQDVRAGFGLPHLAVANKGKDGLQYAGSSKVVAPKPSDSFVTAGNDFKPAALNSPRTPPSVSKKTESLELLKEELRKKQEMLEQRRNEFRQQLDKLAKQATGKTEVSARPAEKRQKVETSTVASRAGNTKSEIAVVSGPSSQAEVSEDKILNIDKLAFKQSKVNSANALLDSSNLKQTVRAMASFASPFHTHRYKLDNRPTTFRITAPLPADLADATALRGHFALYGEITNVEIEDSVEEDSPNDLSASETTRNCSARVSFATRHSAERAFLNAKSWHGHNLHFVWATPSIATCSRSSGESSSAHKGTLNAEVQSAEKTADHDSMDPLGPKDCNLSPLKSPNELSCDSPKSSGRGNSPLAVCEKNFASEVQSPDKSASYIPLETDEPENRDSEVQEEEECTGDDMKPEKDPRAASTLLTRERVV